jgi:hypothetical protein
LSVENVDQWSAAVERDCESFGEASEDRHSCPRGKSVEGSGDRRAGADLAQHSSQVSRQLSLGPLHHSFYGGDWTLTSGHRQREQVGNRRELGNDLLLAAPHGRTECLVTSKHSGGEGGSAGNKRGSGREAAALGRPQDDHHRHTGAAGRCPPQHLLNPEVFDGLIRAQPLQTPANRGRTAQYTLDSAGQPVQ